jgi:hypothetical protein
MLPRAGRKDLTKSEERKEKDHEDAHNHASRPGWSDLKQMQWPNNSETACPYPTDNAGENQKAKDPRREDHHEKPPSPGQNEELPAAQGTESVDEFEGNESTKGSSKNTSRGDIGIATGES